MKDGRFEAPASMCSNVRVSPRYRGETLWRHIKRWFPIALFAIIIYIPSVLFIGTLSYLIYNTTILNEQLVLKIQQMENVKQQQSFVHETFETIVSDCRYFVSKLEQEDGAIEDNVRVADDFARFSALRGVYDQIRFLDSNGYERIRINRLKNGQSKIVPKWMLQSKGNRYYFRAAASLKRGQIFVSPLDLNKESGMVERPLKPMIRLAGPIYHPNGTLRGVIVLNYRARDLLARLDRLSDHASSDIMMINREGYWFVSPWPREAWGFMFDAGKERTFGRRFPVSWAHIKTKEEGQVLTKEGLFSYTTLYPLLNIDGTFSLSENDSRDISRLIESSPETRDAYSWTVLTWVKPEVYFAGARRFTQLMLGVNVLLSIAFLIGSIVISLYRAKRRIAETRLRFQSTYNATAAMISGTISSMSDIHEVERLLLKEGKRFISYSAAALAVRSEANGQWRLFNSDSENTSSGEIDPALLIPLFDAVAELKAPLRIDDIAVDKRFSSLPPSVRAFGRIAIYPAMAEKGVVGVLAFGGGSRPFSDCEANVLQGLSHLYALAIQRQNAAEQILHMAHYDQLTGLTNRYLLEDRMKQMLKDAKRYEKRVACLFIDLDKFKPINDRFGHEAGDLVLKRTAERLVSVVREADTVARLGGDEFVVLVPDIVDPSSIKYVATRILETIQIPIETSEHTHTVGASIGIAFYPDDGEDVAQLKQRADAAMYDVKTSGRNGWKLYNTAFLGSKPSLDAGMLEGSK